MKKNKCSAMLYTSEKPEIVEIVVQSQAHGCEKMFVTGASGEEVSGRIMTAFGKSVSVGHKEQKKRKMANATLTVPDYGYNWDTLVSGEKRPLVHSSVLLAPSPPTRECWCEGARSEFFTANYPIKR